MTEALLQLTSERLRVVIRPEKGCDILGLVDLATGVDVLWRAPWGIRRLGQQPYARSSRDYWIEHNGGGWNLMLPNAGDEREVDGALMGFHGEAAVIPWVVEEADESSASLSASLLTAPLSVRRVISVVGNRLTIEESVTNESPDPASFRWGHHPTFGAPFIGPGVTIEVDAGVVEEDAQSPGGERSGRWPQLGAMDLSVVPPAAEPRALLAYLSDFPGETGRYRIVNEELGLAVVMEWPLAVFPYLWLWQELRASPGYPWYQRAYALALEPHSAIPSAPSDLRRLDGGATETVVLSAMLGPA